MKKSLPLYKQIIEDILEKISNGTLRPNDRVMSEHELSEAYHVSSITSKNALTELADKGYLVRIKGKGTFVNSQEILLRIPEYAQNYSRTSRFSSNTIGLIPPTMKTGIDQQLLDTLEREINLAGYSLSLSITRENQEQEAAIIEKLRLQGVKGMIIFPAEHELYNEAILRLALEKFPFVLVDRYLKGIRSNIVRTDNYDVTQTAVLSLIQKGCRNIVFLSPDSSNTVTAERLAGFRDVLLKNFIPWNTENICPIPLSVESSEEKEAIIRQFLNEHSHIDGIFCVNHEMARYVSRILTQNHLWNQYQVCAFDYSDDSRVSHIVQDIPAISKLCVKLLTNTIQYDTPPAEYLVKATFVDSVCP